MECQAINLWLLRGDESLELMHQAGVEPSTPAGSIQKPGEGIPGNVSDDGEPVLIADPEDSRLGERSAAHVEGGVFSLLVVPILDRGALVGVVEAITKLDRPPIDTYRLFPLSILSQP